MRVSFSPLALRQLENIHRHISLDSPASADAVVERIYQLADFLARFPQTGMTTNRGDVRVIPANPYPYLVFFRKVPGKDELRILRVLHGARQRRKP